MSFFKNQRSNALWQLSTTWPTATTDRLIADRFLRGRTIGAVIPRPIFHNPPKTPDFQSTETTHGASSVAIGGILPHVSCRAALRVLDDWHCGRSTACVSSSARTRGWSPPLRRVRCRVVVVSAGEAANYPTRSQNEKILFRLDDGKRLRR